MDVKIEESWKAVLREEFDKEYFSRIAAFLHQEKREGKTIYPPGPLIFNAFRLTPFEQVKVVILGQDPYHGPGQAHGLSFSVQDGVALPPSLQNIYKEISNDIGTPAPASGNLERLLQPAAIWRDGPGRECSCSTLCSPSGQELRPRTAI